MIKIQSAANLTCWSSSFALTSCHVFILKGWENCSEKFCQELWRRFVSNLQLRRVKLKCIVFDQRSYLSSKRMTRWIQFYAEEDAKMMMMFQKKNVPKIDLTDKREALVFFPDQSFLYENTGFSSIFFWMGSRIKLSPPQDEISFVKDLDMSIKSVKAQKRHLFHQFLPFKSSLFSSSALAFFSKLQKIWKYIESE